MPSTTAGRLETVLRGWEDFWYLAGITDRILESNRQEPIHVKERALIHWSKLRKTVLQTMKKESTSLDVTQFMVARLDRKKFDEEAQVALETALLPTMGPAIIGWCLHSRRIYHVSADLLALLQATSLERVKWEDVTLPFSSFAISLGKPIVDSDGDAFDYILVSSLQDKNSESTYIDFRFFAAECDHYIPLTEANRRNIEQRIKRGERTHVYKLVNRFLTKTERVFGSRFEITAESREESVTTTAERVYADCKTGPVKFDSDPRYVWDNMVRIVVGLCLYMKTLPSPSPHRSEWRKAPRSEIADPRSITSEAEICTVTSCYVLNRTEKVLLGLEGDEHERKQYELTCHFREGHWRRAPGTGHDPTAPKIVHVRPTIVRRDKLQEGQLPAGTTAVLDL